MKRVALMLYEACVRVSVEHECRGQADAKVRASVPLTALGSLAAIGFGACGLAVADWRQQMMAAARMRH